MERVKTISDETLPNLFQFMNNNVDSVYKQYYESKSKYGLTISLGM